MVHRSSPRPPENPTALRLNAAIAEPVVLRDVPLLIDADEMRAFHGYRALRLERPDAFKARLDAARETMAAVIHPRLVCRVVGVAERGPHHLTLAEGSRLDIPHVGAHWGPVEAVAAAFATVGVEAERLIAARREVGDADGADCLDSAASAAVECLAEWANDRLCQLGVAAGLRVTNRISPGLAGWVLAEQAVLRRLCPPEAIGVAIDADGALRPAKSLSFLVGVGAARVDHYFVQCRRCWAEGCPARRMPAAARIHDPASARSE